MRQLPKKKVTKIDPRKELSPYLNHQENRQKNHSKKNKVSASLSKLHNERKKSLTKNLGIIVGISLLAIIGLGYYVSPLANVNSVQVKGAADLPVSDVVKTSGIKAQNKILDYRFHSNELNHRLAVKYSEVKQVNTQVEGFNHLIIKIKEYPTIAYIKENGTYRKVLTNGQIGTQNLKWKEIDQSKPLFIGYNQKTSLTADLKLFNSLPSDFRKQVKLLSGRTSRKSQIILVMKDGNLVIGDIATFKDRVKYYDSIRAKAGKNSLIDLEVGAYSRPLTANEKKVYGIS